MTTIVSLAARDFIVVACDSLATTSFNMVQPSVISGTYFDQNGDLKKDANGDSLLKHESQLWESSRLMPVNQLPSVTKLFDLKPFNACVLFAGASRIGQSTIRAIVEDFTASTKLTKKQRSSYTMEDVAKTLRDFIVSKYEAEIPDFIDVAAVSPKYFHKPYFLEAQKGGEKAYALLHRTLVDTRKIGIAKVAMRSREYLAAVKPDGLFLMLDLMHFAQEVLEPEGLKPAQESMLSPAELKMAKTLVETMSSEWEPEKYSDQYQTALKEVIERKIQKIPPGAKPIKPRIGVDMPDILAVLQQSIEQGTDKRKKIGTRETRPKTTSSLVRQRRPGAATASKN